MVVREWWIAAEGLPTSFHLLWLDETVLVFGHHKEEGLGCQRRPASTGVDRQSAVFSGLFYRENAAAPA